MTGRPLGPRIDVGRGCRPHVGVGKDGAALSGRDTVVIGTVLYAYALVSGRLTGTSVTATMNVATVTVVSSVFAHGLTAPGSTDRYVRWFTANEDTTTLETDEVGVRSHRRMPRPAWLRLGEAGPDESTAPNEP